VVKLKLYCAVLLFVAALFGAGYFLFGSFGERRAANEGGFASVEEMMLTHRLGLASRAEYLAYWEAHQARKRKEREIKAEMDAKERTERRGLLEETAALEHRVQSLPRIILAVASSDVRTEPKASDQFKLACQIANEIDPLAIIRGAEIDLFGPPKINEMVRSNPASFATVEISNPVRWDDLSGTCQAWFTVDGVYNGVRYQGYYYGIVYSFQRDDQRGIIVMHFDQRAGFVNSLE
jgi:hypothetical protein